MILKTLVFPHSFLVYFQFPFLRPGEKEFVYQSCITLSSSQGSIEGSFTFVPGRYATRTQYRPSFSSLIQIWRSLLMIFSNLSISEFFFPCDFPTSPEYMRKTRAAFFISLQFNVLLGWPGQPYMGLQVAFLYIQTPTGICIYSHSHLDDIGSIFMIILIELIRKSLNLRGSILERSYGLYHVIRLPKFWDSLLLLD